MFLGLSVVYIKNFDLSEERDKEKNCLLNREKEKLKNIRLSFLYTILILLIMLLLIDTIVARPYLAEVYAYQGGKYYDNGNYKESLLKYKYANTLNPFNGRVLFNLGVNYYILGIYEEAEKIFKESIKYYNDRNVYGNLGLCYMRMGDYQQAEKEFKYAIYLNPRFSKAYFNLGLLYFQKGNYEKAIEQLEKIFEIEPNYPENYVIFANLGLVYKKKKMPDKALEYFIQALKLVPEGSPIIEEIEKAIYDIYRSNPDK
jgi:tetratricopeptide (TPR) repeat protein